MRGWDKARRVAESGEPISSSVSDAAIPPNSGPRTSGRRGRFNPNIDWELGKHLFSKGELLRREGGLPPKTVYPSFAEIASRIGCTKQNVQKYADRHNWVEARQNFVHKVEEKLDEVTAESRARLVAEPLAIVDSYINRFFAALGEGKVRTDAAADLDKMVRLRAFLTEREREKSEQKQVISLEDMQAKHRAMRATLQRVDEDEAIAGVLSGEDAQTAASHGGDEGEAAE